MQQPSSAREQPRFTDLATFALRLSQAYTSWRDPHTGADALSYFQPSARHTGDELGLRATLIRDHILPAFQYEPTQIEFESRERYDMVLRSQKRRRIAIIETKSSSLRNLIAVRRGHETPTEQLGRYLSQAGLYLGVLTNGDEWHLFDFAVGREPLASLSLIELAQLLQGIDNREAAQMRLYANPSLQQSLAIIFYYLDARRWEQTDVFRANLSNAAYFQVASLQVPQQVETLVQHIKQVLSSLRETIRTQFALLRQRYEEHQQLCTHISSTDARPFAEALQDAIEKVGQFGTAFHMYDDGQLKMEILTLLQGLSAQYLTDDDIAAFESDYLQQAQDILTKYQLSQTSLVEKKPTRSVRLLPPMNGLDQVKMLLQVHYVYLQALAEDYDLSIKANQAYLAWKTSVRGIFRAPEDEFCLQTAYIHFVRLFFVRVCEDHALTSRRISDGPFATYERYRQDLLEGIKDTYQRLLTEAYQRASSVYHNFFGQHEFFDWYVLDEYTILALFDLLNSYDFHGLSADVLGRVYNEGYIEAKERSERGQFYTPPQVVDYMLDALGIPTGNETDERKARQFIDKKVGDLSCGSGTFLVAAAARKSKLLQRLVATNQITAQYALEQLTETFLGFDLNPFACYLAEINLLIQCLPFLVDEQGRLCRSINRFHIYCTDALEPTVDVFLPPSIEQVRPKEYTEEGVIGNDVDSYYLRRTRYVAYEKYRSQIYRPRHIALFRTPEKLLLGETSGGYYDRAHLFANHSVQVVVPWTALEDTGAIEEKGIKTVLRESRQIAGINASLAPVARLFDLRYLLGIINSQFIRRFLASNRLEGTREGRIYPDVWKRLPLKVASTQRQLEVAALVDEIQAQYKQLLALPTPTTIEKDRVQQFRSIQGYLARGDIQLVGEPQTTITERPVVKEEHLILRRQPLTYLEAPDAPELLHYLELCLSQLHPELQKLSWIDARQRIQVPPTLEAVRTFMLAIEAVEIQKQQFRTTIQALLAQVEELIEAIYYEPGDGDRLEVIRKLQEQNRGAELF